MYCSSIRLLIMSKCEESQLVSTWFQVKLNFSNDSTHVESCTKQRFHFHQYFCNLFILFSFISVKIYFLKTFQETKKVQLKLNIFLLICFLLF